MIFDLLQVATDLGCQVESLLAGVGQSQQQRRSRSAQSSRASERVSTDLSALISQRTTAGPLDLTTRSNEGGRETPLNLTKREQLDSTSVSLPLACLLFTSANTNSDSNSNSNSNPNANISTNTQPSSNSNASSNSSASCDTKREAHLSSCDINNNEEEKQQQAEEQVQISSTNGRRRAKKLLRNHACQHCGRTFARSDMLTRHSRLHSGLKPYQCAKCLQVFSRSDHLSTHERTHTGEKPYQCNVCSYSACRRDMITRHMRTHTALGRLGSSSRAGSSTNGVRLRVRPKQKRRHHIERDDDVSTSAEIEQTLQSALN